MRAVDFKTYQAGAVDTFEGSQRAVVYCQRHQGAVAKSKALSGGGRLFHRRTPPNSPFPQWPRKGPFTLFVSKSGSRRLQSECKEGVSLKLLTVVGAVVDDTLWRELNTSEELNVHASEENAPAGMPGGGGSGQGQRGERGERGGGGGGATGRSVQERKQREKEEQELEQRKQAKNARAAELRRANERKSRVALHTGTHTANLSFHRQRATHTLSRALL